MLPPADSKQLRQSSPETPTQAQKKQAIQKRRRLQETVDSAPGSSRDSKLRKQSRGMKHQHFFRDSDSVTKPQAGQSSSQKGCGLFITSNGVRVITARAKEQPLNSTNNTNSTFR